MKILSVNTGTARPVRIGERTVTTAYAKTPRYGAVGVRALGLDGDEQADPSVHGGLSKAVYAYGANHHPFWQTVRAQARVALWNDPLGPGAFGENLTLDHLDEADVYLGDHWILPDATLVVTEPRQPCAKFNHAMGFAQASRMLAQSGWCGAYLAVLREGTVRAGDTIGVVAGRREVNLRELFQSRRPSWRE